MNIMQIKKTVMLLLIVGIMPLCASENTQKRRSLRLIEKHRRAQESEENCKEQATLSGDDNLRNIMFQPIDAETFRKIVEESKSRGY